MAVTSHARRQRTETRPRMVCHCAQPEGRCNRVNGSSHVVVCVYCQLPLPKEP